MYLHTKFHFAGPSGLVCSVQILQSILNQLPDELETWNFIHSSELDDNTVLTYDILKRSPSWIKNGRQTQCCIEYSAIETKFGIRVEQ